MLEKNTDTEKVAQIDFDWEKVKNKAASKREELVANAPKVVKRAVNTSSSSNAAETTRTTDTLTDPYHSLKLKSLNTTNSPTSKNTPNAPSPNQLLIDNKDNQSYIEMDMDMDKESNTPTPQLLPRASAQRVTSNTQDESHEVAEDESLGPERNAVEILQGIREKSIAGASLTRDERRLVVRSMKELGQTQDAIAELLQVSRRTIVNDYKVLRNEQALAIQVTETSDIAGEVYSTAKTCIRRAMQAGSFKTVSTIMRDMVEVLQSLGVVYRAPKTSMQATMYGDMTDGMKHNGFQRYMDGIGKDKNKVVEVLDCMFNAIDKDDVN